MLADLEVQIAGAEEQTLSKVEQFQWLKQLDEWRIEQDTYPYLAKEFKFKDFKQALAYANRLGELADSVNHHPQITLSRGRVEIQWWTHALAGLHLNDFIMAARSDLLAAVD